MCADLDGIKCTVALGAKIVLALCNAALDAGIFLHINTTSINFFAFLSTNSKKLLLMQISASKAQ